MTSTPAGNRSSGGRPTRAHGIVRDLAFSQDGSRVVIYAGVNRRTSATRSGW